MTARDNDADSLLEQVSLATYDIDDLRKERLRLSAQSVLAARSEAVRQSVFTRKGVFPRYLEPALVSGFSLFVLLWAVERTVSILSP